MANKNSELGFEKLNGRSKYTDWKFGMKMALVHAELWQTRK